MRIHLTIAACLGLVVATSSWAQEPAGKKPALPAVPPAQQAEAAKLNSKGAAALRQGEFGSAIQAFDKLAQLAPAVAEFHANLGFAYYSAGRFREAIPPSRQALKLKPSLTGPHYFLAFVSSKCRQKGGAREKGQLSPALPLFHEPSCRGAMSCFSRFFRKFGQA
jgi:tetratricopeptide (TPR) repeat protein